MRYENRQYDKEFVKVTINLKDTLAMVKLCESIEQDVLMSCDKDGDPVSLRPTREFAGGHYASSEQQMHGGENPRAGIPHFDFDAEMVLAAMLPDEEEEEEDDEEEKRKEEEARRKDDEAAGRMTINYNNVPPQTPGHRLCHLRKRPKAVLFDHRLVHRARIKATKTKSSGMATTTKKKKSPPRQPRRCRKDTSLLDERLRLNFRTHARIDTY